jgi:hypothetical protein
VDLPTEVHVGRLGQETEFNLALRAGHAITLL